MLPASERSASVAAANSAQSGVKQDRDAGLTESAAPARGALGPARALVMGAALTGAIAHLARSQLRGGRSLVIIHGCMSLALLVAMILGADARVATAIVLSSLVTTTLLMLPTQHTTGAVTSNALMVLAGVALVCIAVFAETPRYAPIFDTFSSAGDGLNASSSIAIACAAIIIISSLFRLRELNTVSISAWSAAVLGVFAVRALSNRTGTGTVSYEFTGALQAIAELVILPMSFALPLGMEFQYITPLVAIALSSARAGRELYGTEGKADGLTLWRAVFRMGWASLDEGTDAVGSAQERCKAEGEASGDTLASTYQACLERNGIGGDGQLTAKTLGDARTDQIALCKSKANGDMSQLQRCLQSTNGERCVSSCIGEVVAEPGTMQVCFNHNDNLKVVTDKARRNRRLGLAEGNDLDHLERKCLNAHGHSKSHVQRCTWLPGTGSAEARCVRGELGSGYTKADEFQKHLQSIKDESDRLIEDDDSQARFDARMASMARAAGIGVGTGDAEADGGADA